jgi:uncharacterized protein (TIGR03083 family)
MKTAEVRLMFTDEQGAASALARALTPEQWDLPSLCDGWTVRDVVAHMARHIHPGGWRETVEVSGKRAARREREYARSAEGLIDALSSPAPSSTRGLEAMAVLNTCELVIHQQDVRRPIAIPRRYPDATLRACLDFVTSPLGNLGVADSLRRRGRGLRLVATDVDWSAGHGPEVAGPGEALLLALAGRAVAIEDLSGPGTPTLASRLGSSPRAVPDFAPTRRSRLTATLRALG